MRTKSTALFTGHMLIAGASALSLLLIVACSPRVSGSTDTPKGPVAATVNGVDIPESRVALALKQQASQGRPNAMQGRSAMIDGMVVQQLLTEEALRRGLDKDPEVQMQIDLLKQSVLTAALAKSFAKTPTTETLQAAYAKYKSEHNIKDYKVRQILVATEPEALAIVADLRVKPQDFGAVAKAKSLDKVSAGKDGDLGWIDPKSVIPQFGAMIVSLEPGKVADVPLKSQFGYHILLVDMIHDRDIAPFEQMREMLTKQTQVTSLRAYANGLKAKSKIVISPAPDVTAPAPVVPPAPAK